MELARSLREPDLVADLCQETFLSAWRACRSSRAAVPSTWLYRIAINLAPSRPSAKQAFGDGNAN